MNLLVLSWKAQGGVEHQVILKVEEMLYVTLEIRVRCFFQVRGLVHREFEFVRQMMDGKFARICELSTRNGWQLDSVTQQCTHVIRRYSSEKILLSTTAQTYCTQLAAPIWLPLTFLIFRIYIDPKGRLFASAQVVQEVSKRCWRTLSQCTTSVN